MSESDAPVFYVCKYTPVELFAGFGASCRVLDDMPESHEGGEAAIHANLCGFGKAVIQAALSGDVEHLVLVNCCDVMRRAFDVIKELGCCDFLFLLDLPHCDTACARTTFASELIRLRNAYATHCGHPFDLHACLDAFAPATPANGPYAGILGVRAGRQLEEVIDGTLPLPVRNLTCTGARDVFLSNNDTLDEEAFFKAYADALLAQVPCQRMMDASGRARLFNDPHLTAVVYHTIKFCDFYGSEYADIKHRVHVPLLKLESDFTRQSAGQLSTRIEAFAESLSANPQKGSLLELDKNSFVAGIDSGSASTDVVIMDCSGSIVASAIIPTGGGAQASAEKSLEVALAQADIPAAAIVCTVATGYGRDFIEGGIDTITEITCHARGAHYLDADVRTIIDIGGQDSKVISIDETGAVKNFVMNDKCAAGTGRFLEMMARTLGLSLQEMGQKGLDYRSDVDISNMCTVFAESEVVTLVAQNAPVPDIVHGLNKSVAAKTAGLVKRVGGTGAYMMTGGVAQNPGIVAALEDKLDIQLRVVSEAQICGAIGAALFALEG